MTKEADDPRIGQVIADRYRVEARLGEGGMGIVYLTEHVHMRKRYAVKVLHREMTHDEQVVARFERESVAAARIEHPNVVAAKDFGRLRDGAFYLVLDYVVGVGLRDLIKRGPIDPARAMTIARQIASALNAAHGAGIIHRDLKPDNVMLVQGPDGSELVKVLDFGIAKLTVDDAQGRSDPLTQFGTVFGTPEYMSPEQAMGQLVDHRADLYALGVVLFEMLAGRLPFQADEPVALITQHMIADPPPLPSHIDPAIAQLVLSLLAKSPAERPQSASELVSALDALLGRATAPGSSDSRATDVGAPPSGAESGSGPPARVSVAVDSGPGLARAVTQLPTSAPRVSAPTPPPRVPPPPVTAPSPSRPTARVAARTPAVAGSPPTMLVSSERPLELGHLGHLLTQLLTRQVRVRGKLVPVWAFAAIALVLIAIVITLPTAILSHRGKSTSETASEFVPKKPLAARASRGDAAAIAELEAKPQDDLDLDELLALATGRLRLGRTRAAVEAYKVAVERDANVIKRPYVVHDVRRAADDPAAARAALELAATKFGATGADILFDVREDAQPGSTVAGQADDLLDSAAVRNVASEALRIALDLARAKKCDEFKDLMPRAIEHADRRSLPYLEKLTKKHGCGRRSRHDCYHCLRGDNVIDDAIQHARTTAAPSIEASLTAGPAPSASAER